MDTLIHKTHHGEGVSSSIRIRSCIVAFVVALDLFLDVTGRDFTEAESASTDSVRIFTNGNLLTELRVGMLLTDPLRASIG